jgi:adenine-specific DNA-methyltransferase
LAAQLAELVPDAVADGKVDVEKLRELLADDAASGHERFGLFWPGKKRALRAAQAPTTATLKPDFARSKEWDTTQNVFIEGDNLEVLKILQRHYHNKIKLIYIDPPYNTGKDFVYPDNYKEGLDTYLEWTRQVNEEGKKVSTNSESDGRYHSNWLNMMYPRLKLARNLLTDDGVILISIDSHEQDNLHKLCNEVFGESNHKNTIAVRRGIKNVQAQFDDVSALSQGHEYILLYSRAANVRLPKLSLALGKAKAGKWDTFWRGTDRATMRYELFGTTPETGQWRWEKSRTEEAVKNYQDYLEKHAGEITIDDYYIDHLTATNVKLNFVRKNAEGAIQYYVPPTSGKLLSDNWMDLTISGNETNEFDTEKSVELLKRIVGWQTSDDDNILDFFAGSATTAHAVMQLNAEDGGKRRFIMVQLPEPTPEDSEARKAGFKTIADISRKRIELAGEKIKAGSPTTTQELDTGFRAYTLSDTSFTKWRVSSDITPDKLEQRLLALRSGSADDDAKPDDLLIELLLKLGFSLTETVVKETLAGLETHKVGDNLVLAYLNEHIKPSLEQLRALVDAAPAKIIVLEDAFQGDDELKTNLAQYAETKGVELWTA